MHVCSFPASTSSKTTSVPGNTSASVHAMSDGTVSLPRDHSEILASYERALLLTGSVMIEGDE